MRVSPKASWPLGWTEAGTDDRDSEAGKQRGESYGQQTEEP